MEIKGKKAVIVGGASGMAQGLGRAARTSGARRSRSSTSRRRRAPRWRRASAARSTRSTSPTTTAPSRRSRDAVEALGGLHIAVNTAGGGTAKRTLAQGRPAPARRVPARRSSST